MGELTELQRAALRWVVRAVRAGQLRESFRLSWIRAMDGSERASLRGFTGDASAIPPLSEGAFAVLVAEGYLGIVITPGSTVTYTYTVRQAAYDAVDGPVAEGAPPAPRPLRELRRVLASRLAPDEVATIAFDMGGAPVVGETHDAKVRELLAWAQRMNRLDELRQVVRELRPDIDGV